MRPSVLALTLSSLPRSWTSLVCPARPNCPFGGREVASITCNKKLGLAGQTKTPPPVLSSQAIEEEAEKEVEDATQFATSSPVPDPGELYTSVYSDSPDLPIRGCDPFTWGKHSPKAVQRV